MNFDEWERNIIGATGGSTPEERFYADQVDTGVGAALGRSSVIQGQQEEAARRQAFEAARRAEAERAKQIEDKLDPSKARMVPKDDGGYDFYDGSGEKINVFRFSRITGARPDDILKDSMNQKDIEFVKDYSTFRELATAYANEDKDTLSKMRARDPKKYDELLSQYNTPAEMLKGLQSYYSDYFSDNQSAANNRDGAFMTRDRIPVDDKGVAALSARSTYDQLITPTQREREPRDFLGRVTNISNPAQYGPLAALGGGWLWGEEAKARRDWESRVASNPWVQYRRDLGY